MLEDNVIFKSDKILKYIVKMLLFNKKNLVASSEEKSKFVSKNTLIEF